MALEIKKVTDNSGTADREYDPKVYGSGFKAGICARFEEAQAAGEDDDQISVKDVKYENGNSLTLTIYVTATAEPGWHELVLTSSAGEVRCAEGFYVMGDGGQHRGHAAKAKKAHQKSRTGHK
jgi:hypothetical protein